MTQDPDNGTRPLAKWHMSAYLPRLGSPQVFDYIGRSLQVIFSSPPS